MGRRHIACTVSLAVVAVLTGAPAGTAATASATAAPKGDLAAAIPPQRVDTNRLVSLRGNGRPATEQSAALALSADGRVLAFSSSDPQLVRGQAITGTQVYLRDLTTGATQLVSRAPDGNGGNGPSREADISADGTRVVFSSAATNLVSGDTNGEEDVFLYDATTGLVELVSTSSSGQPADGASGAPAISADGGHVVYDSDASNIAPVGPFVGTQHVYLYDAATTRTRLVDKAYPSGHTGGLGSNEPDISADGSRIVFSSLATNLTPVQDQSVYEDIFVWDRNAGGITRITRDDGHCYGPSISADGSVVAFYCRLTTFTGEPVAPGIYDVWTYDLTTGAFDLISDGIDGTPATDHSYGPTLSADGATVAFYSIAPNLVPGDTNASFDVFRFEEGTGTVELVSRAAGAGGVANGYSTTPVVSGNGSFIAYSSDATNIVKRDPNRVTDVFVYRVD